MTGVADANNDLFSILGINGFTATDKKKKNNNLGRIAQKRGHGDNCHGHCESLLFAFVLTLIAIMSEAEGASPAHAHFPTSRRGRRAGFDKGLQKGDGKTQQLCNRARVQDERGWEGDFGEVDWHPILP